MEQTQARQKGQEKGRRIDSAPTASILRGLLAEARRSPDREAYRELAHGCGCRLAISVTHRDPRPPRYTVVVLLDARNGIGSAGRIPSGRLARVGGALAARRYVASRLDEGWIEHERSVAPSRLAAEWRFLERLLEAQDMSPEGCA